MTLPNLSEWHLVPEGATIPARIPYYRESGNRVGYLWLEGSLNAHAPKDRVSGLDYYTEKPIEAPKKTLEDVIREGVEASLSAPDLTRAVEAFYAEQEKGQPRVIVDNDGPGEEWRLNRDGTYDWWRSHQENFTSCYRGYTREEISEEFGIKEERY